MQQLGQEFTSPHQSGTAQGGPQPPPLRRISRSMAAQDSLGWNALSPMAPPRASPSQSMLRRHTSQQRLADKRVHGPSSDSDHGGSVAQPGPPSANTSRLADTARMLAASRQQAARDMTMARAPPTLRSACTSSYALSPHRPCAFSPRPRPRPPAPSPLRTPRSESRPA